MAIIGLRFQLIDATQVPILGGPKFKPEKATLKSSKWFAGFAAIFAMTGVALAEEAHTADNSGVLESIYAEMDQTQTRSFEIVMASVEERLAAQMAKIEKFAAPKPAETFTLASN